MISSTKLAEPAIRAPATSASGVMSRRCAHWVHTVSVPIASTVSRRSANGAECGSSKVSARPGTPNHAASPVNHSDTATLEAAAVAATVKAWAHRSGSSAPAVHFTTSDLTSEPAVTATILTVMATFYTILLIVAFLAIGAMAVLIVSKLFAGQQ